MLALTTLFIANTVGMYTTLPMVLAALIVDLIWAAVVNNYVSG